MHMICFTCSSLKQQIDNVESENTDVLDVQSPSARGTLIGPVIFQLAKNIKGFKAAFRPNPVQQ